MTPFDFVKSINEKKYAFQEVDKRSYTAYIVNKAFSFFPDTVLLANEINMYPDCQPQQHYDFLFYSVGKKNRYSKWVKQQQNEDAVLLSERLNIRYDKAVEIIETLSETDMKTLRDEISSDGLVK